MRRTRRAGRKVRASKLLHAFRTGGQYCPLLGVEPVPSETNVVNHADNVRDTSSITNEATTVPAAVQPRQEGSSPVPLRIRSDVVLTKQIRLRIVSGSYSPEPVSYSYPTCWLD